MSAQLKIPGFEGRLIEPSDSDYELARLTGNAACDARPALIAKAGNADDVAALVRWALATGAVLAMRSGGHSVAGHSTGDGVVVLDLSPLDSIEFDTRGAMAWVGPGAKAATFTKAAYERGGAVSFGDTGTVGLGGLITGGGIGWLVRKYGLTIDSLLAAEVVTADGELVTASATHNADLFWALRGGGGNFGVVTRYHLALSPIGEVLHGMLLMPATAETVPAVLALGSAAPDDLTLMPFVMAIPPMDEVPATEHGRLGLWVDTLWAGPRAQGNELLARLRALGPILMDTVAAKPYPAVYPEPGDGPRGAWTSSSIFLDDVDGGVFETVRDVLAQAPPGESLAIFRVLGGAAGRVADDATAYGWRDRRYLVWLIADYPPTEPGAAYAAWVADGRAALANRGSGAFVSFQAADDPSAVALAYPAATMARLREVKARWDPDNLFRHNHNVSPADMAHD
ncbi:MAG: FAD-binding oxidoreductase [Chloroflexota bacterium]|nr:FAD-binding oxidoreductase [Chloroflexota bacterium]